MRGGKHVKVKKRQRQDTLSVFLRLRANADFMVHRDPQDHLSLNHLFKSNSFSVIVHFNWLKEECGCCGQQS